MKTRLFAAFAALALHPVPLPAAEAGSIDSPDSVEQWGLFELELDGPADGNPFTEVRLSATFSDGHGRVEVPGFYDGDGRYRIRFSPDRRGTWHYETKSNRWELTGKLGEFTATEPGPDNHGPVRVRDTFHFAYADGTPYRQVGTTIYNWTDTPAEVQQQTLQTLKDSPFNKARMLLTPQPTAYRKQFAPPLFPYAGEPPTDWDFTRFNPEYFRHYEQRVEQLLELGIEADVILLNPYGRWGFGTMDDECDDLLVRYTVARLGAYRNVWWSLANEYDFLRTKTEDDWDRLGQLVMDCDPHQRLRSIHNGTRIYNHNRDWVTHVSIQNGAAVQEPGRAQMYRDVWNKPVVYDEVNYEGDGRYRWAALSGEDMVHAFWCGTVAGTYVGHGDYFETEVEDTWTSFGGTLSGESWKRLAFLREVLEDGPEHGIEPIDKWRDVRTGGVPGQYYLTYFGRETPDEWTLELYKDGVSEGQRYRAEILDTWEMTVTPVEGEFVTKARDRYHFVDAAGRGVKLPAKPGIAVRVTRIGGEGAPAAREVRTD